MQSKYNHMTDNEFLSYAQAADDQLTSTDIQDELLRRFDKMVLGGAAESLDLFQNALEECGHCTDTEEERTALYDFLDTAGKHHCTDASELKAKLQRADDFYDIAAEHADVLHQLAKVLHPDSGSKAYAEIEDLRDEAYPAIQAVAELAAKTL